ncbi:MAG: glycoside hydrolase family 127 protein [Planctomycetota bacterium]|jgi:DUF1680 family protein
MTTARAIAATVVLSVVVLSQTTQAGELPDNGQKPSAGRADRGYAHAQLRPFAWRDVAVTGGFWKSIRDRSRDVGVPDYLRKLEEHGYVDNFRYVAQDLAHEHHGGPNNNEFVYKHLEALGYYAAESDALAELHRGLARTILAAQQPDGYLNTFFENERLKRKGRKRFQPLNRFELYNFGHFAQAAVAHYDSTGNRHLLDGAVRFANLLVERFADPNDLPYTTYRGPVNQKYEHPNHELAMVDLWRVTGNRRYLDFVRQTLDEYEFFGPKFNEIWGHAVQETLLCAGAADLYLETGDPEVWKVVCRLWNDVHDRKRYIIGGVGSSGRGESYGGAFELPNDTAYCETCAAISLVFWNHKMLLATGETKYADEMERSLYNNVPSGYSLSGTAYFYQNPLRFDPQKPGRSGRRSEWFACSCCPPNVHRLLASLNRYVYTHNADGIQVSLYVGSRLRHVLPGGQSLLLTQTTGYPWEEKVEIGIGLDERARFTLSLRVPAWCEGARASVNGQPVGASASPGYLTVDRAWEDGDSVVLRLPMPGRTVPGDPRVKDQLGRLAVMRGPLVYCLESHDNPHADLDAIVVPEAIRWNSRFEPRLLGGVVTLSGRATARRPGREPEKIPVKAIPYYAWANREPCKMTVWPASDRKATP